MNNYFKQRIIQPPKLFRRLYPEAVWHLPRTDQPTVYLTFDDGPIPEITEQILDQCAQFQILATFFMIGDNVRKYPAIYERVVSENHAIGNHTYHHLKGWRTKKKAYLDDVQQCQDVVQSPLFRPPHGQLTMSQYRQLIKQYKLIMWDVLAYDWDNSISPSQCVNNVLQHVTNGSIIVFHDSVKARKNCLQALPIVIDNLLARGYRFDIIR